MSKLPHSRQFAREVTQMVGGRLTQVSRQILFLDDDMAIIEALPRPYNTATRHEVTVRRDELLDKGELRAIVHLRVTEDPWWSLTVVEDYEEHDSELSTIHVLAVGPTSTARWVEFDTELLAGFIEYWYEEGGR